MQVVNTLAAFLAVIDDHSVSILHALLLGHSGSHDHHVTEQSFMPFFSFIDTSEAISILGDHQKVRWCHWESIFEYHDSLILKQNGGWDITSHYFVKNSILLGLCHLGLGLLVNHCWISSLKLISFVKF